MIPIEVIFCEFGRFTTCILFRCIRIRSVRPFQPPVNSYTSRDCCICCLRSSLQVRQSLGQKYEPCHVQDQELESYQYHFAIDERKMEKESVVHHKVDISTTDEADHQEISKAEIAAWSIFELIGFSFAIVLTIYSIYFVVYLMFFKSGNKIF